MASFEFKSVVFEVTGSGFSEEGEEELSGYTEGGWDLVQMCNLGGWKVLILLKREKPGVARVVV